MPEDSAAAIVRDLHPQAIGLRLYRIQNEDLIGNELVMFTSRAGVETVLRRAAISGTVKVLTGDEGIDSDYYADVYISPDTWDQTVRLDAKSYKILKHRWMRCRTEG